MKTINLLFVAIIAMGLTACGPQNNNPMAYSNYPTNYNPTNYPGGNYPGGCAPLQSGSFGFTAQGARMMGGAVILAGTLPSNSTYPGQHGTVTMGGQQMFNQQQGMIQYQPKMGQSGQIQMVVNPNGGMLSGSIQLSQQIVYALMSMQSGYSNPYYNQGQYYNPTQANQNQLCIQTIALDITHTANMNGFSYGPMMGYINQALVYLTLNNGQTIGPLVF